MTVRAEVLVAEIGSTTTTVSAFAGMGTPRPAFLGQGVHPTTVLEGDVRDGLEGALADLMARVPGIDPAGAEMVACSSAAGGLRMTVHGLVYDMTVKAANEAALGAGAIVNMVTAGDLTGANLDRIRRIRPNIILLAGGVDYGERETVINNARRLAELDLGVPLIYAGNAACQDEVVAILAGRELYVVENVYPRIDHLNVEPARRAIQQVFERHIVTAPGMSRVREMVSGEIMPVPGAVMEAAQVLSAAIGFLVAVDVGGATTDVHSVVEDSEDVARLLIAPEPRAKRTVEGDLGVFVNARNLVDRLDAGHLSRQLGFDVEPVLSGLSRVPRTDLEARLVLRLAHEAAAIAFSRHAGRTRHMYGPTGRLTVAEGKDLTGARWIIGTGGVFARLPGAGAILNDILARPVPAALYPRDAEVVLDRHYIMAAAGVMARRYPEAATRLLASSLGLELERSG